MSIKKELSGSGIYFILILGVIHIAFFIYALNWGNIYFGDYKEYLQQVANLKEHLNWYTGIYEVPFQPDLYSRRPPMYAFFILSIKSIYNSNSAVLFVQSFLSCLNFLGLIKLLNEYKFKVNVFKLLIIFIVFYPSQFIMANLIMTEILFQTFLFWSFYNLIQFIKTRENKFILYYNLLIALALLTKPVLYFFWIINFLFILYLYFHNKKSYIPVFTALIPLAIILIISLYNYNVTGYFHYSSLRHNNLIDNSNYIMLNKEGIEKIILKFDTDNLKLDSIHDYAERSKEKERIATEYIKENFGDFVKFHLKGMVNFFLDPGRFELAQFFRIESPEKSGLYFVFLKDGYSGIIDYILKLPIVFIFYLFCVMIINIIMIISIINFIFEKRISGEIRIYFIIIIGYLCFMSGVNGLLRYKLPLYPIILFSIPFLFERIYELKSKPDRFKE
ncbi:MAG: hypothetical protein M3R36_14530 [Bacteroidota bacterium]|nr:hypothetical protein [Bacteroidota bacterium]